MAKTYEEIQNEIARLQQEAAAIRANELNTVIQEIKAKMATYGITADDLKDAKGVRKPAAVQFRNPATGDAWTGRGRTPRWLAEAEAKGQNRETFRVK
jgi:DNA-binding protein H-NS